MLLAAGADPGGACGGWARRAAAENGHPEGVQLLLNGASPNRRPHLIGSTAPRRAPLLLLMGAGAAISVLLQVAAVNGHAGLARLVPAAGADAAARSSSSRGARIGCPVRDARGRAWSLLDLEAGVGACMGVGVRLAGVRVRGSACSITHACIQPLEPPTSTCCRWTACIW